MNQFEEKFFAKYIPEGQIIQSIIHEHWIKIIGKLLFSLFGLALLPSFIYFESERIHTIIPFIALEVYLILLYLKIIYDIFDRYNDVWIITDKGVVDLDWALFKTDMKTVNYENIEGVEVEQDGIIDKILNKGDIVIHKIGDDVFILEDAMVPYKAVDEIERISEEKKDDEEGDNDKFDLVMDTLAGVVQDYLGDKGFPGKNVTKEQMKEDLLGKIEKKGNTIDLR